MFLKIITHPVFINLNFHMPMVLDLSHPLIMLTGENGSGKSTLLHSLYYSLTGEEVANFTYKLSNKPDDLGGVFLFDAEQHNPRKQLDFFEDNAETREFLEMASHGQIMLSLFQQSFPSLPNGTVLLLDEPEMALSISNQRRVLKMLMELVDEKQFRIIASTHSQTFVDSKDTYVINLDNYVNRNVIPDDMPAPGESTIH